MKIAYPGVEKLMELVEAGQAASAEAARQEVENLRVDMLKKIAKQKAIVATLVKTIRPIYKQAEDLETQLYIARSDLNDLEDTLDGYNVFADDLRERYDTEPADHPFYINQPFGHPRIYSKAKFERRHVDGQAADTFIPYAEIYLRYSDRYLGRVYQTTPAKGVKQFFFAPNKCVDQSLKGPYGNVDKAFAAAAEAEPFELGMDPSTLVGSRAGSNDTSGLFPPAKQLPAPNPLDIQTQFNLKFTQKPDWLNNLENMD